MTDETLDAFVAFPANVYVLNLMNPSSESERFGADAAALIRANLHDVRVRIEKACAKAGRNPEEIRLLPVSKTVPDAVIRQAFHEGLTAFGENKVQEAKTKSELLADLPIKWSVIGHLQANKVKYIAKFASEFQALDSLKIAALLNERLAIEKRTMDVLVQVNTSNEETKFGLDPADVAEFVKALPEFTNLNVRGFMTLAIFSDDTERVRKCFQILRALRDDLRDKTSANVKLDELSMGMSGDFETAIEEGATVVRVGQGIFGSRPGSDAHYWPGLIADK